MRKILRHDTYSLALKSWQACKNWFINFLKTTIYYIPVGKLKTFVECTLGYTYKY